MSTLKQGKSTSSGRPSSLNVKEYYAREGQMTYDIKTRKLVQCFSSKE